MLSIAKRPSNLYYGPKPKQSNPKKLQKLSNNIFTSWNYKLYVQVHNLICAYEHKTFNLSTKKREEELRKNFKNRLGVFNQAWLIVIIFGNFCEMTFSANSGIE